MSVLWPKCLALLIVSSIFAHTLHLQTSVVAADNSAGRYHFVLVHGLGHGAWCWYKVTALLRADGHQVTAVDLTSNGVNKVSAESVTTVAEFVQPLTDVLSSVGNDEKVVLVGHSLGGSVISYAMELFPRKIHVAVFVAALMPADGQLFLPLTTFAELSNLLIDKLVVLKYGNGALSPPTSAVINPDLAPPNFYNRCPPEDIALALSCITPAPFRPAFDKLKLTPGGYGSVTRVYVRTTEDRIIRPDVQSSILQRNPPSRVVTLLESDHCPFFSRPSPLAELLASIAVGTS